MQTEFDATAGSTERLGGSVATRFVVKTPLKFRVCGEVERHRLDRVKLSCCAGLSRSDTSLELLDPPERLGTQGFAAWIRHGEPHDALLFA
jgi:hypothetical protein